MDEKENISREDLIELRCCLDNIRNIIVLAEMARYEESDNEERIDALSSGILAIAKNTGDDLETVIDNIDREFGERMMAQIAKGAA